MSIEKEAADWFARMRGPEAEATRALFEGWYADAAHARAYDRLVMTWEQTKFLANTQTAKSRDLGRVAEKRVTLRRLLLVAGACLLVALLVTVLRYGISELGPSHYSSPSMQSAAVPIREAPRTISLPDGSRVTLDRGGRLAMAYNSGERRLRLVAGRARFEVAHERDRPFIVDAGNGSVIAHGTVFDVALEKGRVNVGLVKGAIEVRNRTPARATAVRFLRAGEKVSLRGGDISLPRAITASDMQWPSDMITFDAVRLADAIAAFNRTSKRPISLSSTLPDDPLVTGSFRRDDPAGFARSLAVTFNLDVVPGQGGELMLAPRQ